MDQVIEGLKGVEVYMDDYHIFGRGDNDSDVRINHDYNFQCFLEPVIEKGLQPNLEKIKLQKTAVNFYWSSSHPGRISCRDR